VQDLDGRLSFLVESVHDEHGIKTHKKSKSLTERVVSRIQHIVHHETADTDMTELKLLSIDDDQENQQPDNKLKESDSIQRAMADIYRNFKLLHNFALINYTGVVKIVKKHDKTFSEYKGKYKNMTEASIVCNEGKDVEKLSDRMVRRMHSVRVYDLPASYLVSAHRRGYTPTGSVTGTFR
jgi:SPX domain protein involved in polyphosphate accumulation